MESNVGTSARYIMPGYPEKLQSIPKGNPPPQFEDREQALEPDMADMAGILELSHQQLKKSIINMLRALIKKVAGMQEQIGNVSREMEIPRKNQNKC